jgi:hypothetical protein
VCISVDRKKLIAKAIIIDSTQTNAATLDEIDVALKQALSMVKTPVSLATLDFSEKNVWGG